MLIESSYLIFQCCTLSSIPYIIYPGREFCLQSNIPPALRLYVFLYVQVSVFVSLSLISFSMCRLVVVFISYSIRRKKKNISPIVGLRLDTNVDLFFLLLHRLPRTKAKCFNTFRAPNERIELSIRCEM